jgi:hypothetical protein
MKGSEMKPNLKLLFLSSVLKFVFQSCRKEKNGLWNRKDYLSIFFPQKNLVFLNSLVFEVLAKDIFLFGMRVRILPEKEIEPGVSRTLQA